MTHSISRYYPAGLLPAILAGITLGLLGCGDNAPDGPDFDEATDSVSELEGLIVAALGVNSKGHVLAGTETGRLHISTDGGKSWALTSLTDTGLVALVINANDDIFVSYYDRFAPVIRESKIYRSMDDGVSWDRLALEHHVCWGFAFGPDGIVFAATNSALFRSADNGDSWERTGLAAANVVALNQSGHIFAGAFYGVRGEFYRSLDGGVSFDTLGLANDYRSIAIDSRGVIYVGHPLHDESGGGISRSIDNGDTWTGPGMHNRALGYHHIWDLAVLANDEILAATFPASFMSNDPPGLYKSVDTGETWTHILGDTVTAVAVGSGGSIYVGTWRGNVLRSNDGGNSWD